MPADQPRTRTVGCKMTDSEAERLTAVAEQDGQTLGEWRSLGLRRFWVAHRFALFAKGWGCFSPAGFALFHSLAQPYPRFYFNPV
jgi:hypothetical protein